MELDSPDHDDTKSRLTRRDPDAGKDWRQEKKGTTEDEMAEWHHWLNKHEFEQTLGVGEGQGGLACYSPWGSTEQWTTEQKRWMKSIAMIGRSPTQGSAVNTEVELINFKLNGKPGSFL